MPRKPGPWETTEENYIAMEPIYPGFLADYYQHLNDEEKRFFSEASKMFEDVNKRKSAQDLAIGIIEQRRVAEGRAPERYENKFARFSGRGLNAAKGTQGDRFTQTMFEGQNLARNMGEAMFDDDFMKLTIAQLLEQQLNPNAGGKFFIPKTKRLSRPVVYEVIPPDPALRSQDTKKKK
jgi:hypothetical protein